MLLCRQEKESKSKREYFHVVSCCCECEGELKTHGDISRCISRVRQDVLIIWTKMLENYRWIGSRSCCNQLIQASMFYLPLFQCILRFSLVLMCNIQGTDNVIFEWCVSIRIRSWLQDCEEKNDIMTHCFSQHYLSIGHYFLGDSLFICFSPIIFLNYLISICVCVCLTFVLFFYDINYLLILDVCISLFFVLEWNYFQLLFYVFL